MKAKVAIHPKLWQEKKCTFIAWVRGNHPGVIVLRDAVVWIVVICEGIRPASAVPKLVPHAYRHTFEGPSPVSTVTKCMQCLDERNGRVHPNSSSSTSLL